MSWRPFQLFKQLHRLWSSPEAARILLTNLSASIVALTNHDQYSQSHCKSPGRISLHWEGIIVSPIPQKYFREPSFLIPRSIYCNPCTKSSMALAWHLTKPRLWFDIRKSGMRSCSFSSERDGGATLGTTTIGFCYLMGWVVVICSGGVLSGVMVCL